MQQHLLIALTTLTTHTLCPRAQKLHLSSGPVFNSSLSYVVDVPISGPAPKLLFRFSDLTLALLPCFCLMINRLAMGPVAVVTRLGLLWDCALRVGSLLLLSPLACLLLGCSWLFLCYSVFFPNPFQALILAAYSVQAQTGVLILRSCREICLQTVI